MNLSPHLPDTAATGWKSWRQRTGQRLDGVIAVDVDGAEPHGWRIRPAHPFPEWAARSAALTRRRSGIYEKFPAGRPRHAAQRLPGRHPGRQPRVDRGDRPGCSRRRSAIGEALDTPHGGLVRRPGRGAAVAGRRGGGFGCGCRRAIRWEAIVLSTSNSKPDAYLDRWLT